MNDYAAYGRSPLGVSPGQTVGAQGFTAPSTGGGWLSESRAEELCGSTGSPKTPEGDCGMQRKSLQWKHLPPAGRRRAFRLRPTAAGFMQVSVKRSWTKSAPRVTVECDTIFGGQLPCDPAEQGGHAAALWGAD